MVSSIIPKRNTTIRQTTELHCTQHITYLHIKQLATSCNIYRGIIGRFQDNNKYFLFKHRWSVSIIMLIQIDQKKYGRQQEKYLHAQSTIIESFNRNQSLS